MGQSTPGEAASGRTTPDSSLPRTRNAPGDVLLEVKDLTTYFYRRDGVVRAVDGVSFAVRQGETLGIVGESGSGKSVTALSLVRLIRPPGRIVSGAVLFQGEDLLKVSTERLRQVRGQEIGMIFQDPMSSLNPTLRIGRQVAEPMFWHGLPRLEAFQKAISLLAQVGIPAPSQRARAYPFEFSGGMRQRAMIASAVSCEPKLLIADEPTTALDVTVQAQILDLIQGMQERFGTAALLITHDFGVAAQVCDRIMVMYGGRVAELAPTSAFLEKPTHPYSVGLLGSTAILGRKQERLQSIPGAPPNMIAPPAGCRFHPRCPHVMDRCRVEQPPLFITGPNQVAACWLHDGAPIAPDATTATPAPSPGGLASVPSLRPSPEGAKQVPSPGGRSGEGEAGRGLG